MTAVAAVTDGTRPGSEFDETGAETRIPSGSVQEVPNEADSAPCVPRSVVVADELFGWRDGARRGYTYAETIICEVHVDGYGSTWFLPWPARITRRR
jgi:pullulanase/glycogen debranching enzyme